jgi:hypothetical protein
VALVLAPYLIGIRGMPSDEATKVILGWLERYNAVRRLDFRPRKAARQRSNRRRRRKRRIKGIESYILPTVRARVRMPPTNGETVL